MQTNQKGLTLVELLAVIVIFSIVMTLAYQLLFAITKQSDELSDRFEAYSSANLTAQAILNNVYDMKLEKSEPCGSNCYDLINRPKFYIDGSGNRQQSSEVRYRLQISGNTLELRDNSNQVIVTQTVSSSSTITSTCNAASCLEAVITLDLYYDLEDGTTYQSITTIAH